MKFNRIFSTEYMVKPHMRRGDIPSTREAYATSLAIAIPAVIEMVSIALMQMIDTVMVGRISDEAIAAVGLTSQPRLFIMAVFFALNVAVTAIVARNKGAGKMDAARSCLRHAVILVIIFGTLVTVLAVLLAYPFMRVAGAQYDTIHMAASYFRITGFAIPFQILTGLICAAQRACGNTKITLKVNVIAKIISVGLNFLLIEGRLGFPRLEVDGAAISTVIAAGVAFGLAAASVLSKESVLRLDLRDSWKLEVPMLKNIGKLASGGMFEQLALRFGFSAYAIVIASLGTHYFAAHIITMQIMVLSFTFADGISAAVTSLVGQNLGKERPDLSIMHGKIGIRLALICAAMLSTVCILMRYQFPRLFSSNPDVIATSAWLLLMLAFIMPIQTTQIVMGGSLRGAGDTRYVAITMLITVAILRPGLAFLLTFTFGLGITGAWITIIIDQGARLIMLFGRFIRGKWIR